MHKMVDTRWCCHIYKREGVRVVLDEFKVEKEKKRLGFGCLGVKSCNLTCSQFAAIVEGGTALSNVHRTGHCHPRAMLGATATPFRISDITLSSELQF
jgi:hypothetical protein